jgi:hypothetical protein
MQQPSMHAAAPRTQGRQVLIKPLQPAAVVMQMGTGGYVRMPHPPVTHPGQGAGVRRQLAGAAQLQQQLEEGGQGAVRAAGVETGGTGTSGAGRGLGHQALCANGR